jgi:hypothetical protein
MAEHGSIWSRSKNPCRTLSSRSIANAGRWTSASLKARLRIASSRLMLAFAAPASKRSAV